jgi:hypothetical protein
MTVINLHLKFPRVTVLSSGPDIGCNAVKKSVLINLSTSRCCGREDDHSIGVCQC